MTFSYGEIEEEEEIKLGPIVILLGGPVECAEDCIVME